MAGTSLAEHLRAQLRTRNAPPDVGRIAERIIENLDEYGYLPVRLEELAADDAGQQELARQSLALVQELSPRGVAARDLRECLLLQVERGAPHEELLRTIIMRHLEDWAFGRLSTISRQTGYPVEAIEAAIGALRRLKPKPGAGYGG